MRTRGSRGLGRIAVLTLLCFAFAAVFATVAVAQENDDLYTGDVVEEVLADEVDAAVEQEVLAEELAVTGSDTGLIAGVALALLVLGGGLIFLARRRHGATGAEAA